MNLLPLDSWRQELGLSPWHFWGLADSRVVPINSKCSGLTLEYSWQGSDAAGRDDIRTAIETAEDMLLTYLGYRVAPQYVETTVDWPRGAWFGVDATGRRVATVAPEGYVQALGVEQLTPIQLGAALAFSDAFSTGFDDTFTIGPILTTATDPTEIAVYFSSGDRLDGADVSERWRVAPVTVRISGGAVTITGRRWLVVKPVLYERPSQAPLDPNTAGNFVTTLDVYQRTTNGDGTTTTTSQAALIYESADCGGWGAGWCCSPVTSTDPDATGLVVARAGIRDSRLGLITPAAATYNTDTASWSSAACGGCYAEPDRVTLRYLAGYPLAADGQMNPRWRSVVTNLATAELKRRICACRESNQMLYELQQDMTLQSTETERYQVAPRDLDNPFGSRRGHIKAWRAASQLILRRGMTA